MELRIKNMVCDRCISAVSGILKDLDIPVASLALGVAQTTGELDPARLKKLQTRLETEGFELIDDHRIKLVEEIKQQIIRLVHYGELDEMNENLSGYLSAALHKDYHYLSHLFSSLENNTIEQYFILQKIEKVKEWLVYNELTLQEMAYRLGYSSTAHLSNQFKKITGFTPTAFKQLKEHHRKPIDKV